MDPFYHPTSHHLYIGTSCNESGLDKGVFSAVELSPNFVCCRGVFSKRSRKVVLHVYELFWWALTSTRSSERASSIGNFGKRSRAPALLTCLRHLGPCPVPHSFIGNATKSKNSTCLSRKGNSLIQYIHADINTNVPLLMVISMFTHSSLPPGRATFHLATWLFSL